jgi:hypothetical protein
MDILKQLDRSNCRKCGKPTCMAFAVAVSNGQKQLDECPKLEREVVEQFVEPVAPQTPQVEDPFASIEPLRKRLAAIDLSAAALRLGAIFSDGKLTLKCLGKDFRIDTNGNITTAIHVHGWIAIPALDYVVNGAGIPPSGNWVSFRDLKAGAAPYPLFSQMCEKPCKRLADEDVDLFEDILGLFGRTVDNRYTSHLSFVLYPLPKVPILIRYWEPEDGMDSNLNFFFDSTATENLNIESVYLLGTGLVMMFEKIALRHGLAQPSR